MLNQINRKVAVCVFLSVATLAMAVQAVAAMLKPFAEQGGPSFIKYDESERCKDTKTLTAELVKQKALMRAILDFPKAIAKSTLTGALEHILEDMQPTWKLGKQAKADWLVTIMRRLANSQHVLLTAKCKTTQPKWLQQLLHGDTATADDGQEVQYEYGFDAETKLAYRKKVGETDKDLAINIVSDAADHEPIVAHFADSSSSPIAEVTCKTYREFTKAKQDAAGAVLWRGEHSTTKNNLRVQLRADRGVLVSLFEQSQQVCQIPIDTFETADWKQENRKGKHIDPAKFAVANTKTARDAAEQLMVGIAKAYADDQVCKENLYEHRDSLLVSKGLAALKKGVKRKESAKNEAKGSGEAKGSEKAKGAPKKKATPKPKEGPEAKPKAKGPPKAVGAPKAEAKASGSTKEKLTPRAKPPTPAPSPSSSAEASESSESKASDEVVDLEASSASTKRPACSPNACSSNASEVVLPDIDFSSLMDQVP